MWDTEIALARLFASINMFSYMRWKLRSCVSRAGLCHIAYITDASFAKRLGASYCPGTFICSDEYLNR